MKKIIFIFLMIIPLNVYAGVVPEINSDSALIYDLTANEVLYDLNSEEKMSIASLTKIMTTITAIESINDLDDTVAITSQMLQGIYYNASVAGLKVGDVVTYRDLLYASMLPSGADATNSLAISISGSVTNFAIKMNELSRSIGMNNTNFVNVTGLDINNQYSSAEDVLTLLKYALKNETFKEIYTTKEYTLTNGLKVESTLSEIYGSDSLDTSRIIGSKTGFTNNAGYCLASLINSNNHEVILITLGAEKINNEYYHIIDTLNLVSYVDEEIANKLVLKEQATKEQIIIINSSLNDTKDINYKNVFIVILSLLIIIIFITLFCNKKSRRRR